VNRTLVAQEIIVRIAIIAIIMGLYQIKSKGNPTKVTENLC
jgi:hypothetical protein